jgi:MraZ protein
MFGTYQYALDAKGRVFIPAKLREDLGDTIYVSKGADHCLFVYGASEGGKIEERLSAMPISRARQLQRTLFPSAVRFEPDTQGRVLLPQMLRDYAQLTKDVVIVGVGSRAEIWSAEAWRRFDEEELTAEKMVEAMDELGF